MSCARSCRNPFPFSVADGLKRLINLAAGQRPIMPRQFSNDRPLETLIQVQGLLVVIQVIGENRQCELRRAAAAIPPLEFGGAVALQITTETKRTTVNRDFGGREPAPAFVAFHRTPSRISTKSSGNKCSGSSSGAEVWELVTGFAGYAFCRAHSTAYGVEAYQAAWLKRYYPAEFMAAVLTNGKGFYDPLVYVLECHRLGLKLLPPDVNEPGPAFVPHGNAIRVPVTRVKGLSERSKDRLLAAASDGKFTTLADFFHRVRPSGEELEAMIRAGAFDSFGEPRTRQFWTAQYLLRTFGGSGHAGQSWLIPPADPANLPKIPVVEPDRQERLQAESELFGFAVTGHPLELFPDIAWNTYCPVNRLASFVGQTVQVCGLVVEQRIHNQATGEPMKFLSLADWTGIVETELFAQTYKTTTAAPPLFVIQVAGNRSPCRAI